MSLFLFLKDRNQTEQALSFLAFLLVITLFSVPAYSQRPDTDMGRERELPSFELDWCQFKADSPEKTLLEVYYRIPNSGLAFVMLDSGFEASYEMRISVKQDDYIADSKSFTRKRRVQESSRTTMYSDFILNMCEFELAPGKYEIEAILVDLNADKTNRKSVDAKLANFETAKYPKLSGIEFLYSYRADGGDEEFFRKGNAVAVPSVDHAVQGGSDGGPILFYFEIYPGNEPDLNALIDTRISSKTKGLVYRDTLYVMMDQPVIRQVRNVGLASFPPGEYEITIDVLAKKGKSVFSRTGTFNVNWSLRGLAENDYETLKGQLDLIATAEERRRLDKAETVDERLEVWRDFWQDRDPTPTTEENEAMISFYARVRYANTNFSSARREGWKTDRGRVLIKYGPPDEAVEEPMAPSVGAYQLWFYYNFEGEPLRFIFIDEYGDGDYRLQYPYDGRY